MIVLSTPSLGQGALPSPPLVIAQAGDHARRRFWEFFTSNIRNRHTRIAYAHAVERFFLWCESRGIALGQIEPILVAAYIELLQQTFSKPTVKQHLAAIRMLFDYLVLGQVISYNPAASVRAPRFTVKRGTTPLLPADQPRALLDSIATDTVPPPRDRARLGTLRCTVPRPRSAAPLLAHSMSPNARPR